MAQQQQQPPPPPPPPPPPAQPQTKTHPRNPHQSLSPAMKDKVDRQRRLLAELIFPPYVPQKCFAKVESMVLLLRTLNASSAEDQSSATTSPFTPIEWERISHPLPSQNALSSSSPLDDLKVVDRRCRMFRARAQEARNRIKKAKQKAETTTVKGNELSLEEEDKARTTINELNYRYCLAQVGCPERMERLASCWSSAGPVVIKKYAEVSREDLVCRNEREAVERCSGALVERLVRLAIE